MSIRNFIDIFEETVIIDRAVAPELEASKILAENDSVPVLFNNLNGQKAIGNLWSRRERICRALNVDQAQLIENMASAMEKPSDPLKREKAPFMENRIEKFDLRDLAIPKYHPNDGGRYLTSAVVIGEFDGIRNLSFHRMKILDDRRLAIRLIPRDLLTMQRKAMEDKKELPIAIAIGLCPTILLPAAMSVEFSIDELRIANTLRKLCLDQEVHVAVAGNGITVPAYAEFVLEGRITADVSDEGPFVDVTRTVDFVRKQPIVEIDAINHREDAIMQLLLPGYGEHRILMGMPREPVILSALRKILPKGACIYLTGGGCGWLHGVIAITPQHVDDAKKVGIVALEAHRSMKSVVIVDEDIDIFNPSEVEWAIATRFQPHRDLTVLENCRGSSLDPSAGETTSKMIIDATIKGTNKDPFKKAEL